MVDSRAKLLNDQGDKLFSQRTGLLSRWQEQAENFYPERADFTSDRTLGTDLASNLTTSAPLIARRDLGGMLSSMLRPSDKDWFKVSIFRDDLLDNAGRRWCDMASQVQRRAMYDRNSQFTRATKECDHDFVTFGQGVIFCTLNRNADGLLYRNRHLRDVVWMENSEGKIDRVRYQGKLQARDVVRVWPTKADARLKRIADKEPFKDIIICHDVISADQYENERKFRTPFVSVYTDKERGTILEEVGVWNTMYVIPRFQTVSGTQYAHSPATVAALPDARLLQAMTLDLLEAGNKAVNPPMVGVRGAIKSAVDVFAGGITWVDRQYDARTGAPLQTLQLDSSALGFGFQMQDMIRQALREAFFLNKISLPPLPSGTTAYEASQRVAEYIRQALPLFEPIEQDYNGAVCDISFDNLFRGGAFGSLDQIPESLRGQDVQWSFSSPLSQATGEEKGQKFLKAKDLLAVAAELDPTAARMVDVKTSLRDVLNGTVPAKWLLSETDMDALVQKDQADVQNAALIDQMGKGAMVANAMGQASKSFAEAA